MSERELLPAWAMRSWHRRMERHGSERVVRWIAFPDARARTAPATHDAADSSSNDNSVMTAERAVG